MTTPEVKEPTSIFEKVGETFSKAKEWIVGTSEETREETVHPAYHVPIQTETHQTQMKEQVRTEKEVKKNRK